MPTPIMHLDSAEQMLAHPALPAQTRACLVAHWPAFYLGSIAADFQVICDVPREATHFYPLPLPATSEPVGWDRLRNLFPTLASAAMLPEARAVFLAAYGAHLWLDVVWYRDILVPYFFDEARWQGVERTDRFALHHLLLTDLDRQAFARLPADAEATLRAADPNVNLPFILDGELANWQTLIADQLLPGQPLQTADIYAARLHMSIADFRARLDDPVYLERELYGRVPRAEVALIFAHAHAACIALIAAYLAS